MRHTHTAWRFERCGRAMNFGRPPEHDPRNIMDAVLYVDRTGVQWRYLPPRLPAFSVQSDLSRLWLFCREEKQWTVITRTRHWFDD